MAVAKPNRRNVRASQPIHVRVEPEQYDGIAAIMEAEGRTQGDVVRRFIAEGLRRAKRRAASTTP
jgi:hypothetical protein